MDKKRKIIIIAGPTAIGKSDVGASIASMIDGEVVSADSMQIYRHMDIGSAKVTEDEMRGVPHHLIDFVDPGDDYSVAEYSRDARAAIEEILKEGRIAVVVGGTGLYINSLMYDMDFAGSRADEPLRRELEALAADRGADHLHAVLREKDSSAADRIHPNNVKRVIRAIEAAVLGKGDDDESSGMGDFSSDLVLTADYDIMLIVLSGNRMKLYARINKRVEKMIEKGLIEEVRSLKNMGLSDSNRSMQGIGYKEVLYYLDGKYDLDQMISHIKQNSRRYAKRQLTWFRRYKFAEWFDIDDYGSFDDLLAAVDSYIRENY